MPIFMCRCIRLSASICVSWSTRRCTSSLVFRLDWRLSTGVHQAAKTHRLAVEAARCEATRQLRRLADQGRYSGISSTARPDNHQGPPVSWLDHQLREVRPHSKSRLPVHWDAVQHSTFHRGAPAENACKGPVSSSTLDGQSGMLVFMASLVRRGRLRLHPVQWWAATAWCQRTGNWSGRIQVPQWVLSEVACWSSPAVLQGLPLATKETEVTLFTDASSLGLGSPVRLTLDTGTVVSISKIVPHKRSGDAGCHLRCERLPTSSEVPSGATDVRQCSDGGIHQERGGHEITHFDADDHSAAQVVRQQGDYVGSRPSARSAQHPGGFPVQSRPDTDHGVDDGHGESTTRVCQVGRTAD